MVHLKITQELSELFKAVETQTGQQITSEIDAAKCLRYNRASEFIGRASEELQNKFADLVGVNDLVFDVDHNEEMKFHNESIETKKLREKLRLKKDRREVNRLTGRKEQVDFQGDMALKQYEKSTKFAMTYLFALFTSGLGGYFAAKVFFGLDHEFSLLVSAIVMFGTIMVETGLYITKSYKSDLITQREKKIKKSAEERRFDAYYETLRQTSDDTQAPGTPSTRARQSNISEEDLMNLVHRGQSQPSMAPFDEITRDEPESAKDK